jgi:plasmid stabilization system protein ParE
MRIRWTPAAADDLEHIKDYLTELHPHLARSTVLELYEAIRSLKHSHSADAQDVSQEPTNWSFLAYPTLPSTASRNKPWKSYTSIMVPRIGLEF